ncbi:hypothetical protein SLA2020_011440 [Shorea laevis]
MTWNLETVPEKLIYGFSRLQVLRMGWTGLGSRRAINGNISFSRLECLECLKYLNALTITICNDSALEGFLSSHRLHGCTEGLCIHPPKDDSLFSQENFMFATYEATSISVIGIHKYGRNEDRVGRGRKKDTDTV